MMRRGPRDAHPCLLQRLLMSPASVTLPSFMGATMLDLPLRCKGSNSPFSSLTSSFLQNELQLH